MVSLETTCGRGSKIKSSEDPGKSPPDARCHRAPDHVNPQGNLGVIPHSPAAPERQRGARGPRRPAAPSAAGIGRRLTGGSVASGRPSPRGRGGASPQGGPRLGGDPSPRWWEARRLGAVGPLQPPAPHSGCPPPEGRYTAGTHRHPGGAAEGEEAKRGPAPPSPGHRPLPLLPASPPPPPSPPCPFLLWRMK